MNQEIQKIQEVPGGNTENPGTKSKKTPKSVCYRWTFTINNPEIQFRDLFLHLKKISKEFYFQLEKGEKCGTLHYQGCLSLLKKENFDGMKNLLGIYNAHIDKCKEWFGSKNYCQKNETRVAGPWNQDTIIINTITNLYDWQMECLKILQLPPDDRTIYWVYDEEGCKGKTQFCKFMAVHHGATVLGNGALKDIAYALPDNPTIVLFNLTRCVEDHINYTAIEAIKDGMILSSKYESKMKLFNSPHVMIFSNTEPQYEAMSKDRWKVIKLN